MPHIRSQLTYAGLILTLALFLVLAVAACGGSSSATAKVGDCIDAGDQVVDCGSASATKRLVSPQSGSSAIACVQIGAKPQVQVKVGDATFCAEDK